MAKESKSTSAGGKVSKEIPLKEWVPFSADELDHAISNLIHQTFKTVNTKAASGGVRIGLDQGVKLHYVSARTLIGAGAGDALRMDRHEDANRHAIYSQLDAVCEGRTEGVPADQLSRIRSRMGEVRKESALFGGEHVSPRLKQILLPKGDSYVSVSPISCVGVAIKIQDAVSAHNNQVFEDRKQKAAATRRFIPVFAFPVGGGKPLNAGGLGYRMQVLLGADAPQARGDVRQALAIHFKGFIEPPIPASALSEYLAWRTSCAAGVDSNLEARNQHSEHLQRIARGVLRAGAYAKSMLLENIELLPAEAEKAGQLVDPSVSEWAKGLIDPSARSNGWPALMASRIARAISQAETASGQPLALSQQEINTIATHLEAALR